MSEANSPISNIEMGPHDRIPEPYSKKGMQTVA
jgi:hypothetical protein